MNNCILIAEVTQPAQTRYTPDQTAIAEAVVQYPGLRPEDPAGTLKIVGWGNNQAPAVQSLSPGQSYVFEGRLKMARVDRETYKETVTELNVSNIFNPDGSKLEPLPGSTNANPAAPTQAPAPAPAKVNGTRKAPAPAKAPPVAPAMATADAGIGGGGSAPEPDYDGIPFARPVLRRGHPLEQMVDPGEAVDGAWAGRVKC